MKISLLLRSFVMIAFLSAAAFFVSGCASCKPGEPGKPQAYFVQVNLDPTLQQGSVLVDLVGVTTASLPRWEAYSMNQYWKPGDSMRNDADKFTISFVSGKSLTNSLSKTDAKWANWLKRGVTHLLVLADLPGGQTDKPGAQDPRRQILLLGECRWPKKTTNLTVQVQKSGIDIQTPPRPAK